MTTSQNINVLLISDLVIMVLIMQETAEEPLKYVDKLHVIDKKFIIQQQGNWQS